MHRSAVVRIEQSVLGPNLLASFTSDYGSFAAALHIEASMIGVPHWHDTHMPGTVTGRGRGRGRGRGWERGSARGRARGGDPSLLASMYPCLVLSAALTLPPFPPSSCLDTL